MATKYSADLADTILDHIENGETIASVARMEGMPSSNALRRWRKGLGKGVAEDYPDRFESALVVRLEGFVDDLIQIPRDADIDHPGAVQQAKLECDNRRWLLSKMLRERFGDYLEVGPSGDVGDPLVEKLLKEKAETEAAAERIVHGMSDEDRTALQRMSHEAISQQGRVGS